jgi:hypothetical protein
MVLIVNKAVGVEKCPKLPFVVIEMFELSGGILRMGFARGGPVAVSPAAIAVSQVFCSIAASPRLTL